MESSPEAPRCGTDRRSAWEVSRLPLVVSQRSVYLSFACRCNTGESAVLSVHMQETVSRGDRSTGSEEGVGGQWGLLSSPARPVVNVLAVSVSASLRQLSRPVAGVTVSLSKVSGSCSQASAVRSEQEEGGCLWTYF